MGLSDKHQAFCHEYVKCWNAAEAYSRIYPNTKRTTCYANGPRLLGNAEIQAYIQELLKVHKMSADEVLARLSEQARASHEPFIRVNDNGFILFDFSHPEAKDHLHLIKKIKTKRTRRVTGHGEDAEEWEDEWVEVELHDAQAALQLIGKHHALFTEKIKIENLPILVFKNGNDG